MKSFLKTAQRGGDEPGECTLPKGSHQSRNPAAAHVNWVGGWVGGWVRALVAILIREPALAGDGHGIESVPAAPIYCFPSCPGLHICEHTRAHPCFCLTLVSGSTRSRRP
jgi:hypothetical protein